MCIRDRCLGCGAGRMAVFRRCAHASRPAGRPGAGFQRSGSLRGRVRLARGGAEPVERVLEMLGPGPVPVELQLPAAAGADEFGGHGADAVAGCFYTPFGVTFFGTMV